eukprot:2382758-Rhodomonas_salina.5
MMLPGATGDAVDMDEEEKLLLIDRLHQVSLNNTKWLTDSVRRSIDQLARPPPDSGLESSPARSFAHPLRSARPFSPLTSPFLSPLSPSLRYPPLLRCCGPSFCGASRATSSQSSRPR